jgi:hypothetical protein
MSKTLATATMVGVLSGAVVLSAASVHFVKGPSLVDAGTQLVVSGKLAGLGEGDITILVNAAGLAATECTNPGSNVAPGQDITVESTGSVTLPAAKNGNLVFSVATATPIVPNYPTCPNPQWTAGVTDVAFTGGTITVLQGGVVVLQQEF